MKGLTKGMLKQIVAEALKEANVSANAGTYNTPKAFNARSSRPFGQRVERPKRPSHTKMFDFV